MAITEETREEDERLREELWHLDVQKLKKVIKPLLRAKPAAKGRAKPRKRNGG
jgi:hypothetical protein